jgi:hypothetical protein
MKRIREQYDEKQRKEKEAENRKTISVGKKSTKNKQKEIKS